MAEIKNIILDLAGVVMNLNLERDTEALAAAGLPDYMTCLRNAPLKKVLDAYLNGMITAEEFIPQIRPFCKSEATREEIHWAMDAVLDEVPVSRLELIAGLKQRYRVYLLSNIYDSAWQHATREVEKHGYRWSDCFDRLFLSYEMKLAKPDPQIFEEVFRVTGIVPQETIYFDDTRENIEVGRSLGLHACLVPMNHLEACLEESNSIFF